MGNENQSPADKYREDLIDELFLLYYSPDVFDLSIVKVKEYTKILEEECDRVMK